MNYDELLKQFLQKTLNGIDTTVSFFSAQLPDYIHQLLLWQAVKSAIFFFVPLLFFALFIPFLFKGAKLLIEDDDSPQCFVYTVLGGAGTLFGGITMASNLEWLQIMIAPKVYLIEYAAKLIGK